MSVNSIESIGASLYNAQHQAIQQVANGSGAGTGSQPQQAGLPRDQVAVATTVTLKNLTTVRAIEEMHSRLNQLAKGVRESNEAVDKVSGVVGQMNASLQGITKNYPPFPVDSKNREELLMGYSSLRKQIQALMVPPPPTPIYEKVKHMWQSLFTETGQVQPGVAPALDNHSSDKQVQQVAAGLGTTGEQLAAVSTAITQALIER